MANKLKQIIFSIERIDQLRKKQRHLFLALIWKVWVMENNITITEYDFNQLKRAYQKAVKNKVGQFSFKFVKKDEPIDLLTNYAKYLIEYLNTNIKG